MKGHTFDKRNTVTLVATLVFPLEWLSNQYQKLYGQVLSVY